VKLICRGKILEPIKLDPSRVTFGRVPAGATGEMKTVVLTRGDGGPIAPKLAPLSMSNVKAELREIEKGERYELDVSLVPPFKTERVYTTLKLATGVEKGPTVSVSVIATVRPRVEVIPRRFTMPEAPDEKWSQSARLVWDDGVPRKILAVSANEPGLDVSVEKKGDQQQVVLKVGENYHHKPGGTFMVTIETDDSVMPKIDVPVTKRRSRVDRGAIKQRNRRPTAARRPIGRPVDRAKRSERVGPTATKSSSDAAKESGSAKSTKSTKSKASKAPAKPVKIERSSPKTD